MPSAVAIVRKNLGLCSRNTKFCWRDTGAVQVESPLEPREPATPAELDSFELGDAPLAGLRLERVTLRDDLSERVAPDLRLQESRLVGADLSGIEAAGLVLEDVHVDGGSWSNARTVRGRLARVVLTDVRATGLDLAEAELQDIAFRDSRLDLSSFRFATLTRVAFLDCRLEEADFHGATLSSVRFERCALTGASFENAACSRSEIRDCDLTDLVGAGNLGGVRMPWPDIVQVAGLLAVANGIAAVE